MNWIFENPWVLGLILSVLLAIVLDLGRAMSARYHILDEQNRKEQLATTRDGMFLLLSLLLGFTLAQASSRFGDRRSLLIEESVAVGTAYLRAGTLPEPFRDHSQTLYRAYVNARIDLANADLNTSKFDLATSRSKHIQEELWNDAVTAVQSDRSAISAAYLNALNEAIDLHEKRIAAFEYRVPLPMWMLIFSVAVVAVFTRGLTLNSRFWLTLLLLPTTVAIVVALIADLDSPSSGLIRLDHRTLERLKNDLNTGNKPPVHSAFRP